MRIRKLHKLGLYSLVILISLLSLTKGHQMVRINYNPEPTPLFKSEQFSNTKHASEDLKKFEGRFESYLKHWNIKGASMAVANNGKIVYTRGFGVADTIVNKPVNPSDLFRVASISKLITAAAIMRLAEDGKISLEDKVFGPEGILNEAPFNNYVDRRVENISIENLLNHSGGWTVRYGDPLFKHSIIAKSIGKKGELTSKEIIAYQLRRRLNFTPGTRSYYSNLGFVILGEVIEKVAQMPYETFVKLNVMYPIGVYDVYLGNNTSDLRHPNEVFYYEQPDAVKINACDGSGKLVNRSNGGNNIRALGAAGGWVCSATDLLKFVLSIDGASKPFDILSDSSIAKMTNTHEGRYSPIGWRSVYDNGDWIRTGTLAGSTCLIKKGHSGLTYVVLCNTSPWRGADYPFILKSYLDKRFSYIDKFSIDEEYDDLAQK